MKSYFIRRFLLILPTFLGITIMVFTITRLVPGGPLERALAQAKQLAQESASDDGIEAQMSPEQLDQLKAFYGFDKPIHVAYVEWLGKVIRWDLGVSTRYYEPTWDLIKERLPISTFYGLATMILTYLLCIPLGVVKAIKHNTPMDNITSVLVFIGYAVPGFVVGVIGIVIFASNLEWFPIGGFYSDEFEDLGFWGQVMDIIHHAVLPLTAYMLGSLAVTTFMLKNSLLDNIASDYVRTAISKGVSFRGAVLKHAFKNSLVPLATHFGNNIMLFLTGSFLIEKIFDIDGLGLLGYNSVVERDYPVVMGTLVISTLLLLIGNIISDICVALVDPRVSYN